MSLVIHESSIPLRDVYRVRKFFIIVAAFLLGCSTGCAEIAKYNSKDLTLLPCERSANDFFLPVEFDEKGSFVYPDQIETVKSGLRDAEQIYVFVHGWDKTTQTAERDYQSLICRFYTHTRRDTSRPDKTKIIGVFWPSTDFPRWLNFWEIKERVDLISKIGFANLMEIIAKVSFEAEKHYRLVFIGHSFGGRMIVRGLQHYIDRPNSRTYFFLSELEQLQLVLLNAAVSEHLLLFRRHSSEREAHEEFQRSWRSESTLNKLKTKISDDYLPDTLVDFDNPRMLWIPTITELAYYTDVRIFNVFSEHDMADKYLYPLGSILEEGGPACAIGACALSQWDDTVVVSKSGEMLGAPDLKKSNVWNINASEVIYSHSDIYKGRVANLLWEILSLRLPVVSAQDLEVDIYKDPVKGPYWWLELDHRSTMQAVNRSRKMTLRERLERRRYNSLLFDLDGYMKRGHWASAINAIHKLREINYCTPGWWWQVNAGVLRPGMFIDHQYAFVTGGGVCGWPQLFLLLSVISAKLDDCTAAVSYLNHYDSQSSEYGTQEYVAYGDKLPSPYRFGTPDEFVRDVCHLPPKEWRPYTPN